MAPQAPRIEITGWDTLEIPRQLLAEHDRREMQLYKLLLKDAGMKVNISNGLKLSQAKLAILHEPLTVTSMHDKNVCERRLEWEVSWSVLGCRGSKGNVLNN